MQVPRNNIAPPPPHPAAGRNTDVRGENRTTICRAYRNCVQKNARFHPDWATNENREYHLPKRWILFTSKKTGIFHQQTWEDPTEDGHLRSFIRSMRACFGHWECVVYWDHYLHGLWENLKKYTQLSFDDVYMFSGNEDVGCFKVNHHRPRNTMVVCLPFCSAHSHPLYPAFKQTKYDRIRGISL